MLSTNCRSTNPVPGRAGMRWEEWEEEWTGLRARSGCLLLGQCQREEKHCDKQRWKQHLPSYQPNTHPQAATGDCTLLKRSVNGESKLQQIRDYKNIKVPGKGFLNVTPWTIMKTTRADTTGTAGWQHWGSGQRAAELAWKSGDPAS